MCFLKKDLYNKVDVFHVDKKNFISLRLFFSKTFKIWNNIFLLKKLKKKYSAEKSVSYKTISTVENIFLKKEKNPNMLTEIVVKVILLFQTHLKNTFRLTFFNLIWQLRENTIIKNFPTENQFQLLPRTRWNYEKKNSVKILFSCFCSI